MTCFVSPVQLVHCRLHCPCLSCQLQRSAVESCANNADIPLRDIGGMEDAYSEVRSLRYHNQTNGRLRLCWNIEVIDVRVTRVHMGISQCKQIRESDVNMLINISWRPMYRPVGSEVFSCLNDNFVGWWRGGGWINQIVTCQATKSTSYT